MADFTHQVVEADSVGVAGIWSMNPQIAQIPTSLVIAHMPGRLTLTFFFLTAEVAKSAKNAYLGCSLRTW